MNRKPSNLVETVEVDTIKLETYGRWELGVNSHIILMLNPATDRGGHVQADHQLKMNQVLLSTLELGSLRFFMGEDSQWGSPQTVRTGGGKALN